MTELWSGRLKCIFWGPRHWELAKELSFLSSHAYVHLDQWKELGIDIVDGLGKKIRSSSDLTGLKEIK